MTKNTGLKLFTKTWPIKREKKTRDENSRPLTATLEKPTILDIRFIGKIDMSLVRKEFLNITNLCRIPLVIKQKKNTTRPLSLPSATETNRAKKTKKADNYSDSHEDDESSVIQSAKINRIRSKSQQNNKSSLLHQSKKNGATATINDANNNRMLKVPTRKARLASANLNSVTNLPLPNDLKIGSSSTKLPEPCRSCGRPDQPERFHSHPATPALPIRKKSAVGSSAQKDHNKNLVVKSTVQKPVAIRYKSKHAAKSRSAIKEVTQLADTTNPDTKTNMSKIPVGRVSSGKRTLTCYICGREFGTASLPLHEPKCLEKWERENAKLPANLQRKLPTKPDGYISHKEWNKLAWESSQAMLVPCKNCGRTFYPDRLVVHQRSCKTPQISKKTSTNDTSSTASSTPSQPSSNGKQSPAATPNTYQPPSIKCYICGKMFGSHSIEIHERQCLKKWQNENESLPPDMRSTPPIKNGTKRETNRTPHQPPATTIKEEKDERPASAKKSPLFPCYLCGKLFTVHSIYLHEPQCLKLWKIENDKLPSGKRRPQPLKPDIKFTPSGKINFEETTAAYWQTHLDQLVPCKVCSRTFNPDRVAIHERSCKGN